VPVNAAWHRAHRMPKNATLAQRVRWQTAHARACGCRRDMPADIRKAVKAQRTAAKR
jgi:hypothetical protein